MPWAPKRPCAQPGCPKTSDRSYCPEHRPPKRKRTPRPSSTQRGYDYAWQQIRKEILAEHPFCRLCGRLATDVDHIIPLNRGGTSDPSNLQAVCRSCHNRRTRLGNPSDGEANG